VKDLQQVSVIGLGLLGGSVALAVSRALTSVRTVGYTHRPSTRSRARKLRVANEVTGDIKAAVRDADIVIVATPISTFEDIFSRIADALAGGCIVTDVGSTKRMAVRWAGGALPGTVHYVGSHPIAGSEQRGVEFARDDLFDNALCILTTDKNSNPQAVRKLRRFWSALGCSVKIMSPAEHDRIFANVSHVPHVTAAALINANNSEQLRFAGKGFMDTSRIASGPANIWADVLLTNPTHCVRGIDRVIRELSKIRQAIRSGDKKRIEKLLETARTKRSELIRHKMKNKELM